MIIDIEAYLNDIRQLKSAKDIVSECLDRAVERAVAVNISQAQISKAGGMARGTFHRRYLEKPSSVGQNG